MSIRQKRIILGKILVYIFSVYFLAALGCKKVEEKKSIVPPQGGEGEKVIWSSEKERPIWIYHQPKQEGEYYLFVGESEKFALEKGARDAAYRDAIKNAGIFIGTSMKNSFQKLLTNSNIESQIIDRVISSIEFEKQVSNTVVKKGKIKQYYVEQRETKSGQVYWIAFCLLEVPISSINEAGKHIGDQMKELMLRDAEKAKDEKALEQFKSALEKFDELRKKGFTE